MQPFEWIEDKLVANRKVSGVVRKYGPDFISKYGGGVLLGVLTAFAGSTGALVAVGALAAGLVIAVNELDRRYKLQELTDFYSDQIGAILHKDPRKVTVKDLRQAAYGDGELGLCANNVLKSEIDHIDRERNVSLLSHLTAGAAFGMAAAAFTNLPIIQNTLNLPLGKFGMGVGTLVLFQQIDDTITSGAKAVFNLRNSTSHDNIVKLQEKLHNGQKVSRLEVFRVMIGADKDMQKNVKEKFGASFDDLYLSDKRQAMLDFGVPKGLNDVCRALNRGEKGMEAEDLALFFCGHDAAPKVSDFKRRTNYAPKKSASVDFTKSLQEGLDFFSPDDGDSHKEESPTRYRDRLAAEREQVVALGEDASRSVH